MTLPDHHDGETEPTEIDDGPRHPAPPQPVQRVLITGAGGRIGRMLRQWLPTEDRELRFLDVVAIDEPNAIIASVSDPAAMAAACEGVDAVVHMGGTPADANWEDVLSTNIHGTYCVFEAARKAGVHRIVYASSNHAVGYHETAPSLPDDLPPRPDGIYGVGKVFGEGLASLYHDRYGLDVICLRIGTCYEAPPPDVRSLATWLSPRDCARLIHAALTCPNPGFRTVWGISANTRRTWSLDGGAAIGYHPQDDAEEYADRAIAGDQTREEAIRRRVGGQFAL